MPGKIREPFDAWAKADLVDTWECECARHINFLPGNANVTESFTSDELGSAEQCDRLGAGPVQKRSPAVGHELDLWQPMERKEVSWKMHSRVASPW